MAENAVWVYGESRDGEPTAVTLELVSKAAELGDATVVFLGAGAEAAAEIAGRYGAAHALVDPNPSYDEHLALGAVDALHALVTERAPSLLLFGATYDSRDVASRLAARLDCGVVCNCTDVQREGEGYKMLTPWGGDAVAVCELHCAGVKLVLARAKAFAARESGGECRIERFEAQLGASARAVRIVDAVEEAAQGPSLSDAAVVVAGGRGLGKPESFDKVEELAALLGGAVGATRAVVDAGWRPFGEQIGQTGVTVKPSVYIACGISGAVQHLSGMKGSRTIIAINRDPDAPIFRSADLGVVGDVNTVLADLLAEIRTRRG